MVALANFLLSCSRPFRCIKLDICVFIRHNTILGHVDKQHENIACRLLEDFLHFFSFIIINNICILLFVLEVLLHL